MRQQKCSEGDWRRVIFSKRKDANAVACLAVFVCLGLALFVSLGFASPALAQDKVSKVKAVFLFKFFDYVSWPESKNPKTTGIATVCTYGPHPFGRALHYIAGKKSVSNGGKVRYKVRSIRSIREASSCHVVYVARKNYGYLREASGMNVLTVADRDGFVERGGVLEIGDGGSAFKLSINLENAQAQDLVISSQLLKLSNVKR